MKFFTALLVLVSLVATPLYADELTDRLQSQSVTVKAGSSQGSGTIVTRKVGDKSVTFVITAGHVIEHLKRTRTYLKDGKEVKGFEFDDVGLVQEFQQEGRRVGETKVDARVVRYSHAETGEDLAVLMVRKYNWTEANTDFYLDEAIPGPGTELYHVGSLLGQVGANSLTTGIISQTGRVLNLAGGSGVLFDQTTATAFPGSSGGGVFLKKDGRQVGVLVRGAGEGFNFIVPVRRLKRWTTDVNVPWLLDTSIKMPTFDELNKLTVNDSGETTRANGKADEAAPHDSLRYPVLLESPNSKPFWNFLK